MSMMEYSNFWAGCKQNAPVNVGPWNFECQQIFKAWTAFTLLTFVKNKNTNMKGGWNLQHICFVETNHEQLHSDKQSFVQWQIMDIPTIFIWIIVFLDGTLEYGGG
jgi:hypothetical protein